MEHWERQRELPFLDHHTEAKLSKQQSTKPWRICKQNNKTWVHGATAPAILFRAPGNILLQLSPSPLSRASRIGSILDWSTLWRYTDSSQSCLWSQYTNLVARNVHTEPIDSSKHHSADSIAPVGQLSSVCCWELSAYCICRRLSNSGKLSKYRTDGSARHFDGSVHLVQCTKG